MQRYVSKEDVYDFLSGVNEVLKNVQNATNDAITHYNTTTSVLDNNMSDQVAFVSYSFQSGRNGSIELIENGPKKPMSIVINFFMGDSRMGKEKISNRANWRSKLYQEMISNHNM